MGTQHGSFPGGCSPPLVDPTAQVHRVSKLHDQIQGIPIRTTLKPIPTAESISNQKAGMGGTVNFHRAEHELVIVEAQIATTGTDDVYVFPSAGSVGGLSAPRPHRLREARTA